MNATTISTAPNGAVKPKSSFPFDFSMYDENLHYVLYITDDPTEEHKLILELKNTTGQAMELPTLGAKTTRENCNFELHFRRGVLSDKTLRILRKVPKDTEVSKLSILSETDNANWDVSLTENIPGDWEDVSLAFRNVQNDPVILRSKGALTLTLQNISADAGSGARGTRVEFIPHEMRFKGGKNTPVTGNREQHLFITNHSGYKQIPLHVGFKNSNRILNDGTSQNLAVRITNISKDKSIVFSPSTWDSPTFSIEFDYDVDWGLGDKSQVKAIVASADGWQTKIDNQITIKKIWRTDPYELKPGKSIEITFTDIKTNSRSGVTNLYLYYHHVDGYWDGYFVLTIEKTALLFGDRNNVGIGTTNPKAKLAINGGLHVGGDDDPGDDNLHVDGTLTVGGVTTLSGNVGIKTTTNPKIHLAIGDDGTGLQQQGDGNLGFYTNNQERVRIDENGNVGIGIGTDKPDFKLDVRGDKGWIGSGDDSQAVGGWRLGKWPAYKDSKQYVYLTRADKDEDRLTTYQNLAVGDLFVGGKVRVDGLEGLVIKVAPGENKVVHVGRDKLNSLEFNWSDGQALNSTANLIFNIDSNNSDKGRFIDFRANGGRDSLMRIRENGNVAVKGDTHIEGNLFVSGKVYNRFDMSRPNEWLFFGSDKTVNYLYKRNDNISPPKNLVSDARLKTKILPITNALNKVRCLRGLTFHWNERGLQFLTKDMEKMISAGPDATEEENQKLWQAERERQYEEFSAIHVGVIAQDLEAVLPEAVNTDKDGYKSVNYRSLIPLLVEAIKEQQALIERLTARINALEQVGA